MKPREFKDATFDTIARAAGALASPKRLELLDLLAQGERSVEELAAQGALELANASRHLQVLKSAGLVAARRDGQRIRYRIAASSVLDTSRALRALAEDRLAELPRLARDYFDSTVRTAAEVTRLGRWLRASQLDEMPQLWNVLRGDMSVVGPRPIRPTFFEELAQEIPQYWQRLVVRPGLTGLAQTRMGREESWAEKLAHDLEYIADRSVGLYLRVVFATSWRVIKQSAAAVWGLLRGGRH